MTGSSSPLPRREPGPEDDLSDLVERTVMGDEPAARRLFNAVSPIFARAGLRTVGANGPELEDFMQDASLRFFRSLDAFRAESHVRRYAYKIAMHVATDWIRDRRAKKRTGIKTEFRDDIRAPGNPEAELHRRRIGELLSSTLRGPQLEAFVLRNILGCSIAEIAELAGIPEETVRSRIRLAKNTLRRKLDRDPSWLARLEQDDE
ncbi:MAG: sigma-70 family RNA polymerase sigma factor [Myxococcota bacterium]